MKIIQSAIRRIIIGLLISNLFCGCSKEIKLDYKFEKQLVLNAILFAGQPVEIQIQSNFDLQSDIGEKPFFNAKAELFEEGSSVGLLKLTQDSLYKSSFVPQAGKTYKIIVSADGFPIAEASTTIPLPIEVKVTENYVDDLSGVGQQEVNLFLPPDNSLAYYALSYFMQNKCNDSWPKDETKYYYSYYINNLRAKLEKIVDFFCSQYYNERLVEPQPKLFYKQRSTLDLRFRTYFENDHERSFGNKSVVFFSNKLFRGNEHVFSNMGSSGAGVGIVMFYQLSPELYTTLRGIAAQQSTNRDLFVSPVSATTNVKNGLGYFGSCYAQRIHIIRQ